MPCIQNCCSGLPKVFSIFTTFLSTCISIGQHCYSRLQDVFNKLNNFLGKHTFFISAATFTFSTVLFLVDVMTDLILGITKVAIHKNIGEGTIILVLCFIPVLIKFILSGVAYYIKSYAREVNTYDNTLLGIDWLDIDGGNYTNVVLMVFRLDIFFAIFKFFYHKKRDESLQSKKYESKMKADVFVETMFGTVPEYIYQVFIFGNTSATSKIQIISIAISVLSLCFHFTKSKIGRYQELFPDSSKHQTKTNIKYECHKNKVFVDEPETNGNHVTDSTNQIEPEGSGEHVTEYSTETNEQINFEHPSTQTTEQSNNNDQHSTDTRKQIKKYEGVHIWICKITDLIETPAFFITTFPTVSLFSCMYGKRFFIFVIPITGHFMKENWWWPVKILKRNKNVSFYSLYLAYKLLLRILLLGMISIWFIRILQYAHPDYLEISGNAMPGLVWPKSNRFLRTVTKYNLTNPTEHWTQPCIHHHDRANITNVDVGGVVTGVMKLVRDFNEKGICPSTMAPYIFLLIFYVNCIGMCWDVVNFVLFLIYMSFIRMAKVKGKKKDEQCG